MTGKPISIMEPSFWKQIVGALGGAMVALLIFTVYTDVSPMIQAYILPPEIIMKDTRTARRSISEDTAQKFERISNRARASLERFDEQNEQVKIEEDILRIESEVKEEQTMESDEEPMIDTPEVTSASESIFVEELPGSGIAMTASVVISLMGAAFLLQKKKKHA
jgi:hypothetical protein